MPQVILFRAPQSLGLPVDANGVGHLPVEDADVEQAIQQLRGRGAEPMGTKPVQAPAATPTTPTGTPRALPPAAGGPSIASGVPSAAARALALTGGDVAQLLGTGAALAFPPTRRLATPAGLAARTLYGAAREGGVGAVKEGATGLATKALEPIGKGLVRGAQTVFGGRTLPVLERGIPGAAKVAGIPLAAHEMLPGLEGKAAQAGESRLVERMGGEQAEAVTSAIPKFIRQEVGTLHERPAAGATAVRVNLRGLARRVPKPIRDSTMKAVLDDTGIDVTKVSSRQMYRILQREPHQAIRALTLLGQASGQGVEVQKQRVLRTFWSSTLDRATRKAPANLKFPGAYHGGFLDAKYVLKELADLNKRIGTSGMRDLFGKDHYQAISEFSQVLGRAGLGRRFLAREGLSQPEPAAMKEVAERGFRLAPLLVSATGALLGLEVPGTFGTGVEVGAGYAMVRATGELVRDALRGPRANFLAMLLTTPAGTRWLASGLKAQAGGLPDAVVVPALTQSFAQLMRRGALVALQSPVPQGAAAGIAGMAPQLPQLFGGGQLSP